MSSAGTEAARPSADRPLAVLVGGAPATGKTTLAAALAPALHAALLDLDVATGPLTNLVLKLIGAQDLSEPRAAELTRTARYETLFALAEDTARAGIPTVLVAPFTAERDFARWAVVASRLARVAEPRLIWLALPPAELARRLASRGAARDVIKLQDPDGFAAGHDVDPPTAPHLLLRADRPVADLLRDVLGDLAR